MVRAFAAVWAALSSVLTSNLAPWALISPAHDTFELEKSWGVYSPFHAAEDYMPPPASCKISQVNILHRHGARFPSESQTEDILSGVNKLQSAEHYTDPRLDFLDTFVYPLGEDLLVPLGAMQSFESGETAFHRYSSLVTEDDIPFVRASSMSRVVETGKNWTAGFAAASNHIYSPPLSVIISEEGNDTLQDNNCPNAASSHKEMKQWLDVYGPPITARLNSWAPGANLVNNDIHGLLMLCAFHTVASVPYGYTPGSPLPFSPFCPLFTQAEFEAFAYSSDLDRYYSTGPGGHLGRVQGVGYTNELLARLTASPVVDHTSTNATLDSDRNTFPLNRTIYADFTHDSPLMAVFNTLGLFPTSKLNTRRPDPNRIWQTSNIMTFSTRMVVEKLVCDATVRGRDVSNTYVRIMVNEVVQPLAFCGAQENGPWRGLCQFDAFLESQAYARNDGNGDWEKCFL
ncbi:histidine phosphatase superfamily [Mycena alexandri]|uniref:Phytase A n=1 Tax=Mycena alexandri TaxID=1745969 RepID=A0AAD6ST41_9AGAR|nr:histidine phosphatase superfamily [Mycena alexandri]